MNHFVVYWTEITIRHVEARLCSLHHNEACLFRDATLTHIRCNFSTIIYLQAYRVNKHAYTVRVAQQ